MVSSTGYGQDKAQQTVRLQYKSTGCYLRLLNPLADSEIAFKKVPDFDGRVTYGAIPFGTGDGAFMGYARTPEGLYLDKNRNLDLTDESMETFDHRLRGSCYVGQTDISLSKDVSKIPYSIGIDFQRLECSIMVQSGWTGTVRLGDQLWYVTVVDNLDGVIDWNDIFSFRTEEEFSKNSVTSWADRYGTAAPKRLFVDGQAYDVAFAFDAGELVMTLTKMTPKLGELRIEGEGIKRIVLEDPKAGLTAPLYKPEQTVSLPIGSYDVRQVFLNNGPCSGPEIMWGNRSPVLASAAQVSENVPAKLKVGGPLTGKISAQRHGELLEIKHAFIGKGGEEYQRGENPWEYPPPEFAVFKDGKVVTVDRFRYG